MDPRIGWDASAEAWLARVPDDPNRHSLLDPIMLEECGDVRGLRVLDLGCGEGRFSRMLTERGATCVGLDPTWRLLQAAGPGRWVCGVGERLPFAAGVFDRVVAYLSLVDIDGFEVAVGEAVRTLRPGGVIVLANLHPMVTTFANPWAEERRHVRVDDYHGERAMEVAWCGIHIVNWHRSMQVSLEPFLKAGLILRAFLEPSPSEQAVAAYPGLRDAQRVPWFMVQRWHKP